MDKRLFPSREALGRSIDSNEYGTNFDNSNNQSHVGNSENVPLRASGKSQSHFCSPERNGLRVIIVTMVVISFSLTVALIFEIYNNKPHVLKPHSAVVSDSSQCSRVGISMLHKKGSAVDAAVATVLCLGVMNGHDTGIGGGGLMLIHDHKNSRTIALDFRESIPSEIVGLSNVSTDTIGSVVGIPGLLHGLFTAHKMFGKLPWNKVVKPAEKLARNGFFMSQNLNDILKQSPRISDLFKAKFNVAKRFVKRLDLADTLKLIGTKGIKVFYNGTIGKSIVEEVNKLGGRLRMEDFSNYLTVQTTPLEINWRGLTVQTTAASSSGPVLLKGLGFMEHVEFQPNATTDNTLFWESYLEALNFTFDELLRTRTHHLDAEGEKQKDNVSSKSADSTFNQFTPSLMENRGSNIVVLDDEELIVSLVSGLGSWFGSGIITNTGIIMNDAVNYFSDFSQQAFIVKNNKSEFEQRPPTTLTPVVAFDKSNICGLRIGSGGASTTLVLQVLLRNLMLNLTVEKAVDAPRMDINFLEKQIFLESDLFSNISEEFSNILSRNGYKVTEVPKPYISINFLAKKNDESDPYADPRGGGGSADL